MLLMGIVLLILSVLSTDLSVAFRLFIGFIGAVNLLEAGEHLLRMRRRLFARLLGWLSWGCFFVAVAAGALALYQAIVGN